MKRDGEVEAAWFFWNFLCEVSDLVFDRYQDEFMDLIMEEEDKRHMEEEYERYLKAQAARQGEGVR
jgi:hypothetical protein